MNSQLYLYCVIPNPVSPNSVIPNPEQRTFEVRGLRGTELSTICWEDLAMLVGPSPEEKYKVTREDTIAHYRALEIIMRDLPVLPVKYGTIAKQADDIVERVLKLRADEFRERVAWVSDKEEIGFKAHWLSMEKVYQKIRESSPMLQEIAAKVSSMPAAAAYYDRIEAGRLVKKLLDDHRDATRETILNRLRAESIDCVEISPYGDEMVANAAFIVQKSSTEKFEAEVQILRNMQGDNLEFRVVRNCVPYNFIKIVIDWGEDYVSS